MLSEHDDSQRVPAMTDGPKVGASVCAVVVTYGDRWANLKEVLDHLEEEVDVTRVVVVDNASRVAIEAASREAEFHKVMVLRQERNTGSAGGFAAGMEFACSLDADFIMLFDNDNVPQAGTIGKMLQRLTEMNSASGTCLNAILPVRNSQITCIEGLLN